MNGKKIAGFTAAGVLASAVVDYAATDFLLKIAMNRETPKAAKVISDILPGKTILNDDFTQAIEQGEKRLKNKASEKVEIIASDGTKLIGHWCKIHHPKRIVVAMHGWKSTWQKDFGMISSFLENNGCNVLYVEQRGTGESEGDYIGFGICERFDCRDWVNYVSRMNPNLPIYLAGVSMGATTVLMASELDLPEQVHGIVADGAFTSPHEIWNHIVQNNLHMMVGLKGEMANSIYQKKVSISNDKFSTIDALQKCKVPVLFIHGSDDHFVPVEMTYKNYKACQTDKKMLIVPGAGHCMSYFIEKDNYEKAVLDFWKQND